MKPAIDLNEIRGRLLKERQKLLESLQFDTGLSSTDLLNDPDLEEQAAYSALLQLQSTMRSYTAAQLTRIEKAINRIDKGSYGKCLKCGKDISPGRLRAMPYAEYCIPCQSRKENYS